MEAPEHMETEEPATVRTPAREGMGINVAPDNYQPAPPRYIRADEDSEDEEEDIEAPYLAPKPAPPSNLSPGEKIDQTPADDGKTPTGSLLESSDESIPELIDLRDGEDTPTPSPSRRVQHPGTLNLPALNTAKAPPETVPEVQSAEVPEEQIIYIDDDAELTPLQLLEKQVDSLLMPPPMDTTLAAQKTYRSYRSLGRGVQLLRVTEDAHSPGTIKKKSLQERHKAKALKLKVYKVAKMHTGPINADRAPELAKLTSAVVPLQRLRIQDDPVVQTPEERPEAGTPALSQK